MSKHKLDKVPTGQLFAELRKRGEKEHFTWYFIDLNGAREIILETDNGKPKKFRIKSSEKDLIKAISQDAHDTLQDLLADAEISYWQDSAEFYADFFKN